MPGKSGNGVLRLLASADENGRIARYSLAYINLRICAADNGRVLGYDNNHGYHHKHFMGKEEAVHFTSFEEIAEHFDIEWRALHEKAKNIIIKTGTADDFMVHVKNVMRAADRNELIKPSHTLTFADPKEMLHFLSDKKIALINLIRNHPDSITNIANAAKRHRAAVSRDIYEMEKFGLVKIHDEINAGHGRHKIVELTANKFKLEAII